MIVFFEATTSRTHDKIIDTIQQKINECLITQVYHRFLDDLTALIESKPSNNKDIQAFFSMKYPNASFSDPDNLSHYLYNSHMNTNFNNKIAIDEKGVYLDIPLYLSSMMFKDIQIINNNDELTFFELNNYLGLKPKFSKIYSGFLEWGTTQYAFIKYLKKNLNTDNLSDFLKNENNLIYNKGVK